MRTSFRTSFLRDLKAIREKQLLVRVKDIIDAVENAETLASLQNLKSIRGAKNYYRIRVGEYRLGVCVEGDSVAFVRFLHRREIYRYFP